MYKWLDAGDVPQGFGPTVVTIGNFDGVHRGHQFVFDRVVARARDKDAASVALTFDPHPALVHKPTKAAPLLTGLKDKLELIEQAGLDATLVLAYSLDFAQLEPAEFVRIYLVDLLAASVIVIGRDVRFGKNNAGDLDTLSMWLTTMGHPRAGNGGVPRSCANSSSGARWARSANFWAAITACAG